MSLSVESLTCQRGGRTIIDSMSFSISKGQSVILRGPNGAGKSTLLRTLAGLIPAQNSQVTLNDFDLKTDLESYQENIVYAGHLDAIKPQLTVGENIDFWSALFGEKVVEENTDPFSLKEIWNRPAHTCSAGQKRRLGLARLTTTNRALWLLDEPTVSLDTETTAKFAKVVDEHCNNGGMALIATHIDLGLKNSSEIRVEPHQKSKNTLHTDPFLTGDWA